MLTSAYDYLSGDPRHLPLGLAKAANERAAVCATPLRLFFLAPRS